MIEVGETDDIAASSLNGKEKWGKMLQQLSVRKDKLFWNGQQVPPQEELEEAVHPAHIKENERHCMRVRTLIDALMG